LFHRRFKLLISPKKQSMSICTSGLADLFCDVTIFVACVVMLVIIWTMLLRWTVVPVMYIFQQICMPWLYCNHTCAKMMALFTCFSYSFDLSYISYSEDYNMGTALEKRLPLVSSFDLRSSFSFEHALYHL
jgi:hypothetical protein